MSTPPTVRCLVLLALASTAVAAQPAPDLWTGFDGTSYELISDAKGYRLVGRGPAPLAVPKKWLAPAQAREEEEDAYVSSLDWGRPVTAFPIGDGRVGLHLSSYTIATEGSAQAAAGRDLFLVHDPRSGELEMGLDLGETKGRVRLGGCLAAWYHRFDLGDVDCDGRLDLGVVEERIDCTEDEDEETRPLGPLLHTTERRWFVLGEDGWRERPALAGRLPCFGMRAFPPLGVEQSPVDWVLGMTRWRSPLLPPRGGSGRAAPAARRPEDGPAIELARAGLRLRVPPGWTVDDAESSWARIVTPEAGIDVRVQALSEGSSLEREMAERVLFERRLSETVKLLSPHLFLEDTGWTTPSGLRGRRAMFGFAGAPRRLLYYLINARGELVSIDVQFRQFETSGFWDRYDRVLREGLEMVTPLAAAASQD